MIRSGSDPCARKKSKQIKFHCAPYTLHSTANDSSRNMKTKRTWSERRSRTKALAHAQRERAGGTGAILLITIIIQFPFVRTYTNTNRHPRFHIISFPYLFSRHSHEFRVFALELNSVHGPDASV